MAHSDTGVRRVAYSLIRDGEGSRHDVFERSSHADMQTTLTVRMDSCPMNAMWPRMRVCALPLYLLLKYVYRAGTSS